MLGFRVNAQVFKNGKNLAKNSVRPNMVPKGPGVDLRDECAHTRRVFWALVPRAPLHRLVVPAVVHRQCLPAAIEEGSYFRLIDVLIAQL